MPDEKRGDTFGGRGSLSIDDSKVYIVRRKADGNYKIFHDGREEKIEPSKAEEK
jgi:hypothetical protein